MIFWFSSAASFLVGERERATVGALTTQETPSKLLPPNPISEILSCSKTASVQPPTLGISVGRDSAQSMFI